MCTQYLSPPRIGQWPVDPPTTDAVGVGPSSLVQFPVVDRAKCHVLFAPRHGIHAVPEFAIAARPELTVASVHARYGKGIPAPRVYGNVGSKVLVTGLDGSVQFISDGSRYSFHVLPPSARSSTPGKP